MKKFDESLIRIELSDKWYSNEEINKIIQWTKDIRDWKTYTAEEVYRFNFSKQEIYA